MVNNDKSGNEQVELLKHMDIYLDKICALLDDGFKTIGKSLNELNEKMRLQNESLNYISTELSNFKPAYIKNSERL